MVEVQSNDSKRPIIPSSLMLSPIFSVNIPRDPQPEIFRNSSAKARYVTCSDLQHRVLACPGYCSHGFYAENWGDSNDISIGVNPGWCFGTWLGFDDSPIILGMECHHPKWRTPSFFRGVGTPPTRTQWAISNWGFWHWVYRHVPCLGWLKRTPALFLDGYFIMWSSLSGFYTKKTSHWTGTIFMYALLCLHLTSLTDKSRRNGSLDIDIRYD